MSFKSLLFCPDEKTARAVTQVLSELDFTVEYATEAFAAVKRLTDEQFDALVVDSLNEQDASLLFKAARNSSYNHGSLSVAVVEGQAGVAKAFRIGANLVLTKPINIEQSKSTLRVARGLLRKNQQKAPTAPSASTPEPALRPPAPPVSNVSPAASSLPLVSAHSVAQPTASSAPSAPGAELRPSTPFSALEVEQEPAAAAGPADAAVLDSLPSISGKRSAEAPAPVPIAPIAASTSGQAAAAAPATEKKLIEFRPAGASPLVTNEPIVREAQPYEPPVAEDDPVPAPTFSSYGALNAYESSGGKRFLKIVVVLLVLGGAGYWGWPKLRNSPILYKILHRSVASISQDAGSSSQGAGTMPSDSAPPAPTPSPAETSAAPSDNASLQPSTRPDVTSDIPADTQAAANPSNAPIETIKVQELPDSGKPGKVTVTPKPEPIIVTPGKATSKASKPTAPAISITGSDNSSSEIADLVPSNFVLPKPAPGTIRISQGVSQGMLLKKVSPVYPPIAKEMGREGTVELLATVDRYGDITKVRVLSGDSLLARSAVDAVKQWRYRPYLLNGQPVEIETQISIVFKSQK